MDSIPARYSIKEVTIGSKVTHIAGYTFMDCESLTSISIPDSVICIGDSAFSGCPDALFDPVTIPGIYSVDGWIIGSTDLFTSSVLDLTKFRGIADFALGNVSGPYTITTLILPDTFTNIGYLPFKDHKITNMPQTSSERVVYLLTNNLLHTEGYGDVIVDENGMPDMQPFTTTITCKDGIVNATSILNDYFGVEGWDITITPLL